MANTTLHDNEVLLRNANKTITNLREDNRRLSDELKNKTSLLSTCVEVAHEQSLRISSLTAALQDTWHLDPTTCPRPSLCSTPVRPPPWTEVACGRGKPVAASLPSRCLELSNRYDPLLHMGLDADPSPSLTTASPALASGVSTASRSGGRSRKHSSTASPAPASRSAGCLAPFPPASRAGGPNRKHGSAAASSAPASCVPTAARSGYCPALSPRATYGVRSCSTAGPEQQRPRQVATSATRRRLLREAVLRRSGNLHHPNCTPGSPPMAAEVRELNPPEVSDSVLQFASWGVHGQQLLYIFENNIYYQTDVQSSSWRLTSSGQEGIIFNGITDWLYEEEVLHTQVSHWWSPDGSRLAYLTINNSLVPNMLLPCFTGSLYPRGKEYPYPKMGQINPTARLYVVTVDGSSLTTELRPPDSFEKSEYYVTMVKWVTQEMLSIRWMNRAQNMSILSLCDVTTSDCTKKHVMTSEKWLDRQNEEPVFSKDCSTFFITMPLKQGGHGTFNHITMISNQSEGQEVNVRHLTSGSWEVSQILAYDERTNSVVSTVDPFHKECLTCSLFKLKCTYYDTILSPDYQHVLLNCKGPGIPQTTLHTLNTMNKYKTLERNTALRHALINRTIPKWERKTVQINNFALRLELIVPKDLDETKEHPLLLILDSAPGGQAVSDRFSLGWDSVLVSSGSIIVARLDGRGSGFQGQRILHEVHQRLGTVDIQDQITALEHLIRLPYIDGNKIGVYGKAYGGFLSSLLLLSYSSMFRCGIAVAPITNWRLFGSAYAEKYFGSPAKADQKYQISSLLSNITAPSPLNFLIIHGTADATVHFQHSAELVKLLSGFNVNYTLQIFPDEGHNIASAKTKHYMLNTVLTFFKQCFVEEQVVVQGTSKEDD
ncbi:Inactive dipeptidyl peptidase 10 Dipeptidyl peptidase IV-related protein 3 [Larimichthys crocea]|uniref:Inactive dipeptidyl peptidase 10 Dipeptidyl peptidase IV-related protein 3 n=1 Tax=Larimichthys crocea TaxID=215358 RepID=A0A6G0J7T8_LARCR|nr:Inactive dipeptidyl peptidase 10 Dipeptidyl peptidase IV-related protein 3 [Larimichthys crocea]